MCIIAVKPSSKKMFDDAIIKQMFFRNRDGAGLMWTEDETVHFKKGFMTVQEILDFVHSRNWDGVPVVLHFRIGTAGPNNGLNCHPYPIWQSNRLEGECDLCMAHNGILSSYTPEFGSKINDTQVFVNKVLSNLPEGFLESKGIRHLIRKAIGTSRLCFLSKTGKITRFGNWVEDDGYFFSNESYKVPRKAYSSCASPAVKNTSQKTESTTLNKGAGVFDREGYEKFCGARLSFNSEFIASHIRDGKVYKVCRFANFTTYSDAVKELESKCHCYGSRTFGAQNDYKIYVDGVFEYVCCPESFTIQRSLWG